LLAHGRWFSLGTPASTTTKTGRHDIAENIVESGAKTPKIKIMATYVSYIFFFVLGQKLKCRALLSANIPLKKHLTNPAVLLIYV
jgi:hypothetical protein